MATVPRAVKKQAEAAKALQDKLNQPPEDPGLIDKSKPSEEEPAKAAIPDDTPPKVVEEPTKDQGDNWEKRFIGLKQLHDREVPKLRAELESAYSEIDGLKLSIEEVKSEIRTVNTPVTQEVIELTDELQEQYGDDLINVMRQVAKQSTPELVKQVADLQKKLDEVTQGQNDIKKTVQVNTSREFYSELDRAVKSETGKDWKDINKDPEFHAYLSEIVPQTGLERQEFLLTAKDNLEVQKTAQFFIDFAGQFSEEKGALPDTNAPEIPEEIVQPDVKGGDVPIVNEEKVYTTTEVNRFYRDRREGRYKGKEGEAREIEKDILAAGRTGRIVEKQRYAHA